MARGQLLMGHKAQNKVCLQAELLIHLLKQLSRSFRQSLQGLVGPGRNPRVLEMWQGTLISEERAKAWQKETGH